MHGWASGESTHWSNLLMYNYVEKIAFFKYTKQSLTPQWSKSVTPALFVPMSICFILVKCQRLFKTDIPLFMNFKKTLGNLVGKIYKSGI